MNKKIFGVIFVLAGILVFAGVGCADKSITKAPKETNTNQTANNNPIDTNPAITNLMNADSSDLCNSAVEIEAPNALAKELKSIFNEAGGEMKFIANFPQDSQTGDTFIYLVKNKPTTAKLESAFKKHGYKIEMSGSVMVVAKKNLNFSISLTDKGECHEVVVMTLDEPFKLGGAVTTGECKKMLEIARLADYFKNDAYTSHTNAIKLYNYWYMLAAKYGVAKEVIAKTCREKLGV